MGKPTTSATDDVRSLVSGTFGATGQSSSFVVPASRDLDSKFNLSIWGTFSATVTLQRSFDGGTTWLDCYDQGGNVASYTAAFSGVVSEPERGVIYRLSCGTYASGTVNYRLSK